ncbi:MAG: Asp/Glu/hydantoin racemase [Bacteroidia bacterium]|nr:MAG: Asp/Glu/hydantoin racemase [Bacteroidia bacterium]
MSRLTSKNRKYFRFPGRNIILFISVNLLIFLGISCGTTGDIRDTIIYDKSSYYYIDFKEYPSDRSRLPIGIFDSGTGGLAVLNDLLGYELPGGGSELAVSDSIANGGLRDESFIFLADLANMPYGSYALENNSDLLIEHVIKDVQFLLGNKYYQSGMTADFSTDKSQVKAIVIACNTATAYGLDTVRRFLQQAGLDIGVIGVIDAGAQGALGAFSQDENGSIAVLATDGTVKSGAYPLTISTVKTKLGLRGNVQIFQQAGIGIAEAVDENIDFIDRSAFVPRSGYKGPADTGSGELKIDLSILDRYSFDMDNGAMLFEGEKLVPANMQINSVENYITFHLVSLMETMRNTEGVEPLKSVVLACTHYPFFEETFRETLMRLRNYQEEGEYLYRSLISEDLIIVNPALIVADQLHHMLDGNNLLNKTGKAKSEFYISVPNLVNRQIVLREDGSFTYEYKYGRKPGDIQEYVKYVPFSRSSISADILNRLSVQIPPVFDLIVRFNQDNDKTKYLDENQKISNQ